MREMRWGRLVVTAVLTSLPVGCAASFEAAARDTFLHDQPECGATTVRPVGEPGEHLFEVAGCNTVVIYGCTKLEMTTHRGESYAQTICSPTNKCTTEGCDSVDLSVRHAFEKDKACPYERTEAALTAPVAPAPPADVAADPERARLWAESHPLPAMFSRAFYRVKGCGAEGVYQCAPAAYREAPVCTATAP